MKRIIIFCIFIAPRVYAGCLSSQAITAINGCPSIKILVGITSGGASDVFARELQVAVRNEIPDYKIIVENKPGASGNIAAAEMKNKNEACTFMMGTAASLSTNSLNSNLTPKIDPVNEYEHVALIAKNPLILIINKEKMGVSNLEEFMNRISTGELFYSSPGIGSANHLTAFAMEEILGLKKHSEHVAAKGASEASLLIQSGQIDFLFDNPTTAVTLLQNPKMLALGATSEKEVSIDGRLILPLSTSPVLSKFKSAAWFGLVANKSIDAGLKSAMSSAVKCMMSNPEFSSKYSKMGFELQDGNGATLKNLIVSEINHWGPTFKNAVAQ